MTTKVTWPGSSSFIPCDRDRMRHLGGKMLDTRTRLQAAMPADRSASSNEVSFSRCLPTPLVKNISLGTNPTTLTLLISTGPCMVNTTFPTVKATSVYRGPDPRAAAAVGRRARRGLRAPDARDNLALITIRPANLNPATPRMTRGQARETARHILEIIP